MSDRIDEARERYQAEREKRLRADGQAQYPQLTDEYEEFDHDPWVEPGFTREPVVEERPGRHRRRRVRRHAHRHRPARAGHHRLPHRRQGRRLRRHLVLEPLPGLHVRRGVATSTSRCWRRPATCPTERYASAHGDLRALPAHRPPLRPVPARACSRPRSTPPTWDDDASPLAGHHHARRPALAPGSSSPPAASCTRPSCPASTASTDFAGTGVPHRPLGLRLHRRQPDRADGPPRRQAWSASSAPAPPPSRSCRSWPRSAKEVYVFQRTPSAVGRPRPTPRSTRRGSARSRPGWQARAHAQLHRGGHRRAARA